MKPVICAVSGMKNSGKTTIIEQMVKRLSARGFNVATIKHDGHDFKADVPGTDSYRHKQAGAVSATVCSARQVMQVRDWENPALEELIALQPLVDFILLEGFKDCLYPKIEVVRAGVSDRMVCVPKTILAVATDLPSAILSKVLTIGLEEYETMVELIMALQE